MELVFVVRRSVLFERESPQGFVALAPEELEQRFLRPIADGGFFVERRHAENDPSLKQVIPYCVVAMPAAKTAADREPVALCLRRLKKQGEARLHDKLSVGIGGHLNPIDADSKCATAEERASVLLRGAAREIAEELEVDAASFATDRLVPFGLLNDDSTRVGSVHVGVVFAAATTQPVGVREADQMEGTWEPWGALQNRAAEGANFETWSALLLRSVSTVHLSRALATASPRSTNSQLSVAAAGRSSAATSAS